MALKGGWGRLWWSIAVTAALLISLLVFHSLRPVQTVPTHAESTPVSILEKSALQISNAPSDVALAHEIDRVIDESELPLARWGVFVMSLKDGRVLYSRNGDKLFTPASNMKIYTTAVALDLLGGDYRWRTSVYAAQPADESGVINGDLVLYGRGAPDLVSSPSGPAPSLQALADELFQRGVRRVQGNVVGDESYFRGDRYGDGWQWNDLQWYFGAAPSALTVDANAVDLNISAANRVGIPANLELKRQTGFVHLTNRTTTAERGITTTVGINRGLSDNEFRIWGEFPLGGRGFTAYLSVHNPALWAATSFREALIARGIKVDGEPRSRDFRVLDSDRFDPGKPTELAGADSESLAEIVRETNKKSINLNAELILRTLGKERGAQAPNPDPHKMKQRGDDEAGAAVVKLWLERRGISTNGIAIHDGSGLSRLDLVTPEGTARLLNAMAGAGSATFFHDSLPIAGRDGTLKSRLRSKSDRIVAKTGTLSYDHSLSGYATTQDHEVLAFAIFCNDATGPSDPIHVIDQIAGLLADFK